MTEQADQDRPGLEAREGHEVEVPRTSTGDAGVDTVVSTLDRLEALSVEEHLPLFEEAHEALRRALNRPAEAADAEG